MEERSLDISAELRDIITAIPDASALWTQLIEQGHYTIHNIVDYRDEDQKRQDAATKIGTIVVRRGKMDPNPTVYNLDNEERLLEVLRDLVTPANTNAPHSPPVSRALVTPGYQQGGDDKNLLRESGEKSVDFEADLERGEVKLNGFQPESTPFFAKWCSWFPCCCSGGDETNLLLSSAPGSKPK